MGCQALDTLPGSPEASRQKKKKLVCSCRSPRRAVSKAALWRPDGRLQSIKGISPSASVQCPRLAPIFLRPPSLGWLSLAGLRRPCAVLCWDTSITHHPASLVGAWVLLLQRPSRTWHLQQTRHAGPGKRIPNPACRFDTQVGQRHARDGVDPSSGPVRFAGRIHRHLGDCRPFVSKGWPQTELSGIQKRASLLTVRVGSRLVPPRYLFRHRHGPPPVGSSLGGPPAIIPSIRHRRALGDGMT